MAIGLIEAQLDGSGGIKVENIQVKEYLVLDPVFTFVNFSQLTPYIKHTGTPRISWSVTGVLPSPPPQYRVEIFWLGFPSSPVSELEIDTGFNIFNTFFVVGFFQRLKHIQANDSGSEYRVIVTAKQGLDEDRLGGVFKVNFRPTRPVNLSVI
jgi:hypothetical protein